MRPNLDGIGKVMDRIEEIVRKCNPQFSQEKVNKGASERFVEVLDAAQQKGSDKRVRTGTEDAVKDLREHIARCAGDYNIDEELVRAVIQVESGGKADAVSYKGACGLMQLMPRTAKMLGVEDPFDPVQNIEGGVKYLSRLTDKYEGDVEKALAAYNAGPARVDAKGALPSETERYVRNVMALYHRYREEE